MAIPAGMSKKVLAFAGSLRKDSWNKKLVAVGAQALQDAGVEVTLIDLAEYPAPLFDEDLEAASGMPESMGTFRSLVQAHDGYLISTPEYNGAVPSALVNAFHWMSRPIPGVGPHGAYFGKPVALMATSPGKLGGIRVLPRLRDMLGDLGIAAVSGVVSIPMAHEAFNAEGKLVAANQNEQVQAMAKRLAFALRS